MTFHERITKLRKETGLNQKEFAAKHNIEPSKYNKWEKGKSAPDLETMCSLAGIFNVTLDYLAGRTDTPSVDLTIQSICDQTGLDDRTIVMLQEAVASEEFAHYPKKELLKALNAFFHCGKFWPWLRYLHAYIYPNGIVRRGLEELQDEMQRLELGAITVDDMYVLTAVSTYFANGANKAREMEATHDRG